ncbi:MAG: hypothetical protein ACREEB_07590 [Caulobacteraceae bacterium]
MPSTTLWNRFGKPIVDASQAVGVLLAGIGLVLTAAQLRDSHKTESVSLALQFDDRLKSQDSLGMLAIANSHPALAMLTPEGGEYTFQRLAIVLSNYDTLYYLYRDGMIKDALAYNLFCADTEAMARNREVDAMVKYVRMVNKDDQIYSGFEAMATKCTQWDHDGSGRRFEGGSS